MKKNITIKNIDVDLYNQIKAQAESEAISVSDYVTEIFENSLNYTEKNKEILEKNKELSEKNKEISERIKELEEALEENKQNCIQIQARDSEKIKQLQTQLQAYKDQEEQILTITSGEIRVPFNELELALLNFVCERETKRVNKEITPEKLLNKMFVNHAVKGDMYFFKQPTRAEITQLKENLEKQKEYGEE